jgi:hypothetical protein
MTIGELSRRTGMAVRSLRGYASSVYFAGDTDIFPEMSELSAADFPLLPVAGSGPRLPEGEHMSPKRAAEALKVLKPSVAIPIHWGTLAAVGGGRLPVSGVPRRGLPPLRQGDRARGRGACPGTGPGLHHPTRVSSRGHLAQR